MICLNDGAIFVLKKKRQVRRTNFVVSNVIQPVGFGWAFAIGLVPGFSTGFFFVVVVVVVVEPIVTKDSRRRH